MHCMNLIGWLLDYREVRPKPGRLYHVATGGQGQNKNNLSTFTCSHPMIRFSEFW